MCCSPWDHKESDMVELLNTANELGRFLHFLNVEKSKNNILCHVKIT